MREKCIEIVDFLTKNPEGFTKYQLSKELGIHPTTINKYLNKLESFGLLTKVNSINKVLYILND